MPKTTFFSFVLLLCLTGWAKSQTPQGFFLDTWQPATISAPAYDDVAQTDLPVTSSVTIDFADTITKVPLYIYGHNSNPYTGFMSDNPALVKNLANLNMGVMRGPGGSLSDVYFWDRNSTQRPADIPDYLYGSSTRFDPWYGHRTLQENWRSDVDSLYRLLKLTNSTGIITVNYGYARYGTGTNPVAQAAHMAANWVRYDKGRSKFWEIGNETYGNWEAGYQIDLSLNKDAQPQTISGDLYGKHCLVFLDSMRQAAKETGYEIKIGVVAVEASATSRDWNSQLMARVGDKADFYSVHSYFTPYNQNSTIETILNAPANTGTYAKYVWDGLKASGKMQAPVALTEWNIFAIGSKQQISFIDGMFGTMVMGEAIKQKFGLTCRWDLANGYDNGNDHGLLAYNDVTGIPQYTPRPAFYYQYYFRKFFGDVMVADTVMGSKDVVVYPSSFSSGQAGIVAVNKSKTQQVTRFNMKNFKAGERYYAYTLTGGTDNDGFSLKVFVNGQGPALTAGGPGDYESIKAASSLIGDEIILVLPPLSVTYLLVDPGDKVLTINEQYTATAIREVSLQNRITIFPNPSSGQFNITGLPKGNYLLEIRNLDGKTLLSREVNHKTSEGIPVSSDLHNGIYLLEIDGNSQRITKKLVINK